MFLDALLQFDSGASITTTAVSTNIIDLGVNMDIGVNGSDALKLLVLTGTAFATTNSGTLNIQFQASTASGSGFTTIVETSPMAAATLAANTKVFEIDIPRNKLTRYLQLNYVVGTGTFTAGTINYAGIVQDRYDQPIYPSGFVVAN